MIVTKKTSSPQDVLACAGTALALPLLDAMITRIAADRLTAAAPVRRLGFVFYPLGVDQDRWRPIGEGADYQLSEALAPASSAQEQVSGAERPILRPRPDEGRVP